MRLYLLSVLFLAILWAGHFYGSMYNLYVSIPVYDVIMHIWGGIGVGFGLCGFIYSRRMSIFRHRRWIVFGVFLFGLAWELFEVIFNVTGYTLWTKLYYLDTIKDLLDDTIGGLLAIWIISKASDIHNIGDNHQTPDHE